MGRPQILESELMVPENIVRQLERVKARELGVSLAWGAARGVALAAAALAVGCFIDWLVDLWIDTPGPLRGLMLVGHVGLWIGALAMLVVRPLLRRRSDDDVALWCEDRFPEMGHAVISAVQLNRPGAVTEGMSPALIAAVTRQAEEMADRLDFAGKVDLGRLKKGAGLVGAVAAVALIFFLASPETTPVLLARQFLADRDIPRSVSLEAENARRVWPRGEEVVLRFRAKSARALESMSGRVRLYPDDRPSEDYPLVFDAGAFTAAIPPTTADFDVRAWLGDGRTRRASRVVFEPRPVVTKVDAWVLLPPYCGLRPDGTPYEQVRPRGEVAAPLGSSARVRIEAQKPLARAKLELVARPAPGSDSTEAVLRALDLALAKDARSGEAVFDLKPEESAYRIVVEDRNGFLNTTAPKRSISIIPDEPPRVLLLAERFAVPGEAAVSDESEVEGMPIPIGSAVRVAYYAAHPYGLDRARMAWRVLKAAKPGDDAAAPPEVPWKYLPLGEVRATEAAGPFDPKRGCFKNTGFRDAVEFHPMPSPDPEHVHGRTEGGGCFDFQSRPLGDLQPGDQIELFIEVFAKNPALGDQPGRSEVRARTFVTQPQFVDWVLQTLKHESRIRQLEARQRGVFTPEGVDR
jgi:hypothetical protein